MKRRAKARLLASLAAYGLCLASAEAAPLDGLLEKTRAAIRGSGSEAPGPVLLDGPKGVERINVGTFEKRPDGTLVWPRLYFGIQALMDWSSYDFLELTFVNTGSEAVSFSFEVKDASSTDYWTRVNLPQLIGPGLQTIRLPTRLRVGETGRPGRALDSSKVVSLILARSDENDRTPVEVRRIELKKSAKTDAPGILAFHVGPEDAGVPDGFESLNENTAYAPARKWGWLEHEFWTPYPQANRVVAPDRLTASNLTIKSAKLRVDLKPGTYRVWMIIDHPGGFWGEYPYYRRRTVRAQGRVALDESMTEETAKADYFRWQDAEDLESDDLFDLYWSRILREKTFDVKVDDGRLDLDFENEGCPDRVSCFGLALSALAVFPIGTPEQEAIGRRWLARLRESRRAEFRAQHLLKTKALTRLLGAAPPGLRVWDVSPDLDLSRATPADLRPLHDPNAAAPQVAAFRNARGFFAPAVSWKGSGPRAVSWRIEGIPKDVAVEGGWIKYRALRDSYDGNVYSVRERWATEEKRRAFERAGLGRLWLRFLAPRGARPGLYPATLVLSSPAPATEVRVPFELRVFRAQADDLDFPVGPFDDDVAENWWDEEALRPRLERLEERSWAKMRSVGATAFSFNPRIRVSEDGSGVSVETQEVDRVMTAARRLGFLGVVGYGDLLIGENLCARTDDDSILSKTSGFREVADALEARARERHWLPFFLVACDEPVGAAVDAAAQRLANLPRIDASRTVQWSVTTSLGRGASAETRALAARVSLPFLAEFSPEDARRPWVFYNDASRRTLGLEMFRLRQTTALRGRIVWVWNQNMSNPYFDFDGREGDAAWCSSTANERLRCTVDLDRVVDRGLTDYRVALGLKRFLEDRKDLSPERRAEGERLLEEAQSDGADAGAWLLKAGEYQENQ